MEEEQALLGVSDHIKKILSQIDEAAKNDKKSVFLEGPSGTGKEIIATHIHEASNRQGKPFVIANCSEWSGATHHSSMFGHEKGSFTDAEERYQGPFETVGEGTLFLDEIGELPPEAQTELLRVVENREFKRIGGKDIIMFKGRIIAATNRDIEEGIRRGKFRRDFYQRLNQLHIETIPLSKRPEDIVYLMNQCGKIKKVKELGGIGGIEGTEIDPRIKFLLYHYDFPGNVRELITLITSNYDAVLDQVVKRLKSIIKERAEEAEEGKTLKQRRMERALKIIKKGLSDEEEKLICKFSPQKKSPGQWMKKLTRAYEIIMLAERAKLSRDEIAKILMMRRNSLTSKSFKKKYCLTYPDKNDTYKKIRYPVTLLVRLKKNLRSQQ